MKQGKTTLGDNMSIILVKVENRKIVIQTNDGIISKTTIEQLELLLEPLGFVKANQSKLVNINEVHSLEGRDLKFLDSSIVCQVSRRNISIIKDKIRQKTTKKAIIFDQLPNV